jgi:hypothetical protein
MKKLKHLVIVGTVLMSLNGYPQGLVGFSNNSSTPVVNILTGLPAAANLFRVGLYYSLDLGSLPDTLSRDDSFSQAGTFANVLAGGIFAAAAKTVPAPAVPGQEVLVQVRAWSSSFATYEDAFDASAAGSPSALVGHSNLMRVTMGGGTIQTPSLITQGGLQSFTVTPVPEPSMIALSLLGGLGAMVQESERI